MMKPMYEKMDCVTVYIYKMLLDISNSLFYMKIPGRCFICVYTVLFDINYSVVWNIFVFILVIIAVATK